MAADALVVAGAEDERGGGRGIVPALADLGDQGVAAVRDRATPPDEVERLIPIGS